MNTQLSDITRINILDKSQLKIPCFTPFLYKTTHVMTSPSDDVMRSRDITITIKENIKIPRTIAVLNPMLCCYLVDKIPPMVSGALC